MARLGLCLTLSVGLAIGVLFAVDPSLDLEVARFVHAVLSDRAPGWAGPAVGALREFNTYLMVGLVGLCTVCLILQSSQSLFGAAPCSCVRACSAGDRGRTGPDRQRGAEGELVSPAAGRCSRVRRRRDVPGLVGPHRPLQAQLLVCVRRSVCRLCDDCSRSGRARCHPLHRDHARAFLWHFDRCNTGHRWRAFRQRCGLCRSDFGAHRLADTRADLPMAGDACQRGADAGMAWGCAHNSGGRDSEGQVRNVPAKGFSRGSQS